MQITLGLHLDGERSWPAANRLAAPILGPLGFLALLEAQLGLGRDWPSQAERVVQYRDCLKASDSDNRFYRQTFALDELGTAATLLSWRDLWHFHGWDGAIPGVESRRLRDMAEVEAIARGKVSPSIGERLQALLDTLTTHRPPIDEVALVDPVDSFSIRWQQVLRQFPIRLVDRLAEPAGKGFLGEVQRALLARRFGQSVAQIAWRDDGSVAVYRAETRLLAARWMAERLRGKGEGTLLVAGADGLLLDETLAAADLPRQGFRDASGFRPSLQLLPLAMGLLWEPLDLYALLAFLTHPICPLPEFARWRLAAKLADRPGVGGDGWDAALQDIDGHYGDKAPEVRELIRRWLGDERFAARSGAPISAVLARARALAEFFRREMGSEDRTRVAANAGGLAQVAAFVNALERLAQQGMVDIPRAQLEQLIAQVTSAGRGNPLLEAEVGCLLTATDPAAVIEPCHTVIWWQLASAGSVRRYPWSRQEVDALARCGVALPSTEALLAQAAEGWTRPILAATSRLELVLPSEGVEPHPVWLMLKSLVTGLPVRELDALMVAVDERAVSAISHRPLPAPRRCWQLAPGVTIPRRQMDSFTSLNLLLNSPYQWVLDYAARLRPSDVLAVSDGPLLYGNLAHRLVERFYRDPAALTMSEASFNQWLDAALPTVLAEEGAVLLMPGRRADLERFQARVRDALAELRVQLARAGVVQAIPEMSLSGSYAGGEIRGLADLVVVKPENRRAILDMKWGGKNRYPDMLAENRHLQLAIYAELLQQQTKAWPAVAYFLLEPARLVVRTNEFFPGAQPEFSQLTETTAQVWQRFLVSWRWRMDQIEAGCIEVVVDGIEPTAESKPPDAGLAVETLALAYSDFANLVGWGAES